jgi:signal transduction histidine kinase
MDTPDYTRRLERLLDLARQLNSNMEPPVYLELIIESAAILLNCQDCSIMTFDAESEKLKFMAGSWLQFDLLKPLRVPMEHSIAGWVYSHAQPYMVQEASQDPRFYPDVDRALPYHTRSMLAVPVIYREQAIGVMEALNKKDSTHFTKDDAAILETLGSFVAASLETYRLMEEAAEARQQVAELDRLKTTFIAITSHELRTPLGLILGHSAFLKEIAAPELKPQIDVILDSAMRMKEIVEDFAHADNVITGLSVVHREKTDIPGMIQTVASGFAEQARQKEISLRVDSSLARMTMALDAEKIKVALSNLVENAITFTNNGGHVLVKAERLQVQLRISVIDDGIGIPGRDIERIFERFYQVESPLTRKHGGMGLGLSIARDMVELHNGKIWAESVEGRGSRFVILLPYN